MLKLIGGSDANLPKEVEIRFHDRPVERLAKTTVVFWNAGRGTLRGTDVVEGDPIRISLPQGSDVLRVQILKATRLTNQLEADLDPKSSHQVSLSFDYLDSNDGGVIEILHTAPSPKAAMSGTIRGVPKGIEDWGRVSTFASRKTPLDFLPISRRAQMYSILTVALLVSALLLVASFFPEGAVAKMNLGLRDDRRFMRIVSLAYAAPAAFAMWQFRRRFPKALRDEALGE